MNIIFLCRHNLFRSRAAEEYFKKINKNPSIKVSSAGLIPSFGNDCWPAQKKVLKEIGIKCDPRPRGVSVPILEDKDLIVVVADDIPQGLLDNKNYIREVVYWGIPDVLDNNETKARQIVKSIMKRCEELNEKLQVKVPCQ
ncbi:MAG: hypothetical protein Q8Q31_05580 [Nanoarchaeota archaeon]|nr:hypothetical protein [Nanoarchaeota archaeon]